MTRIERVTNDLDTIKIEGGGMGHERRYQGKQAWENDKIGLQIQINAMDNKNDSLQTALTKRTIDHAQRVSEMKHRVMMLDQKIDERSNMMNTLNY